ncbi:GntR family transcriptional regulator [Streptomyces jumonjinensis]|uniref:GntR family transcriptional regulator n=1 Tax=Streptomyces jumonjinensis TaxID=1945 RepID=A0A646KKC6_STRJU|nr:GntR family transcriptional regulator [Streptomyces jumonjinensis]MQT02520.1 GntR family transcriptional regulator [Streptomyces jumonjinensis]
MEQARARETAPSAQPYRPGAAAAGPYSAQSPGSSRVPEQAHGEHSRGEPSAPHPGAAHPGAAHPAHRNGPHRNGSRTVQRHSVRGQILQALRSALADGELIPGEVYSAPVLGERFGVSATPVREAMQRLASEGAVEVVPNRGFRVAVRSPRELAELAQVRALIELPVIIRLTRTVPAARWSELRPLAAATESAAASDDPARYAEADRAFHRAMLALAGNDQLLEVADDLHRRSQWPPRTGPAGRRAALTADAEQHTALLEALISGDPARARSLIRDHFEGMDL